jgi:hypothetical protein
LVSPSSPWLISHGDYSSADPSLRTLVPSGSLLRCPLVQVYHYHLPPVGAGKNSENGQCSYISGSYFVCSLFFRFGGGRLLHNVQSINFRSLIEVRTICFATSSSTLYLKVLLSVLLLLRYNRSFRPWFLMPLLHSGCAQHPFPNICPFEVPLATLSLPGP